MSCDFRNLALNKIKTEIAGWIERAVHRLRHIDFSDLITHHRPRLHLACDLNHFIVGTIKLMSESALIKNYKKIMDTTANLIPFSAAEEDHKKNLKLWLCELTHLTPQQVENLVEHMEQQQTPQQQIVDKPM